MSLFKRRRLDSPPEWASYFTVDEWASFSALVRAHAGRRRWVGDLAEGYVMQPFPEVVMALGTIARLCHAAPRADWAEMIATHLDRAVAMDEALDTDPDQSRALLRARLVDGSYLEQFSWELAQREVAERLHLVLAHDLPTMVSTPARGELRRLGDEDELFALALAQTRAEAPPDPDRYDLPNPDGTRVPVWLVNDESFFTATHALWAEELVGPPSPHGALVTVPNRHTLLVHPILDLRVMSATNHMLELTRRMYAEGPGSISDGLFWLRDGTLTRLPHRVEHARLVFATPDEFLDVLYGLDNPAADRRRA